MNTSSDNKKQDNYPLNTYYTLWYHGIVDKNWDKDSYVKIGEIHSLNDFWKYYNVLGTFLKGIFFLMKEDILPIWEIPENINGGYWSFRVPRDDVDYMWAKLSIQFITQNICSPSSSDTAETTPITTTTTITESQTIHDINGISISPKAVNAVVKIWNNDSSYRELDDIKGITDIQLESFFAFYRPHKKHKDIMKLNK